MLWRAMGWGVIGNLAESLVKNVFCDIVKPKVGSVVKVDLAGGGLSHTGIYVGNGEIVEVTNIDGNAEVRRVSTEEFLCPMFTEYCITGEESEPPGILLSIESALDKKFIKRDYERL